MSRLHGLLASIVVFVIACVGLAGGDRWWELYTPEEQKKIFAEYDKYLYPRKDGTSEGKQFFKARDMFAAIDGQEDRLVKAAIAWGDLWVKATSDQKVDITRNRVELLRKLILCNSRSKGKLVEKMPDRMIDEFFWMTKFGGGYGDSALAMIGNFGPRASRIANDLRDWFAKDGANSGTGITANDVKEVLNKIKKK